MTRFPLNGHWLVSMRHRCQRPEGIVLVSLCGYLPQFTNFQLRAEANAVYDWQLVAGLDVEVIASRAVPFASVLRHLNAIASATPAHMTLGFIEGPQIECGEGRYALQTVNPNTGRMLFDWYPLAIGPLYYADALKVESRLRSELGRSLVERFPQAEAQILKAVKAKEVAWHE